MSPHARHWTGHLMEQAGITALRALADKLRRRVIEMTTAAGSGHPTSCLSCADIMAALFFREMRWDPADAAARDVDGFILSKGHAAPLLWAVLAEAGAIDEDLLTLRRIDSTLEGHPSPRNPWVRIATGALGQGLAAANGIALANRMDGISGRVFCLLGDGECAEGSVWEAAQFAALQKLDNVIAIVDVNGLAQSGPTPYRHDTTVYARRFEAFGWCTTEIDGHDMGAIASALGDRCGDRPLAIIARTVKGKGVSFLEGVKGWHGRPLDPLQMEKALAELAGPDTSLPVTSRRVPVTARHVDTVAGRGDMTYELGERVPTRAAFGEALCRLGAEQAALVVLDGDVQNSTHTQMFADCYPQRFVECYIAEQNMIGTALGLAASGKIPVVATFACFLTRAYDFIRMAGHSQPSHLVLCGSHAGVAIGQDGASQMGLEDLAMMRATSGSTVLYPCDAVSAEKLTAAAVRADGLVYLRTTRGATPVIYGLDEEFPLGGCKVLRQSESDSYTVVAAGVTLHEALQAYDTLKTQGIAIRVIDLYSIKPVDSATLNQAGRETRGLIVVEDHWAEGGIGDAVAAAVLPGTPVYRLAVREEPHSGQPDELLQRYGISRQMICDEIVALLDAAAA